MRLLSTFLFIYLDNYHNITHIYLYIRMWRKTIITVACPLMTSRAKPLKARTLTPACHTTSQRTPPMRILLPCRDTLPHNVARPPLPTVCLAGRWGEATGVCLGHERDHHRVSAPEATANMGFTPGFVVPGTPISVDRWVKAPGVRLFFLTHMHAGGSRPEPNRF